MRALVSIQSWPEGRRFAFTILDDTDWATAEIVRPVYDLLADLGMRTTKSVWMLSADGAGKNAGSSCEDPAYLDWVRSLQRRGFEISLHGAAAATSDRRRTERALRRYREEFGPGPLVYANHTGCLESIYWGEERFRGAARGVYHALTLGRRSHISFGHVEDHPLFWGDLCQRHVTYVRDQVFSGLNTLALCPPMPYHDARRPYVNFWFASSDAGNVDVFLRNFDDRALERLEEEGGLCIVYTHLAAGFAADGRVHGEVRRRLERLARRGGWFAPVSEVLEHLRGGQTPAERTVDEETLGRLERRWLLDRSRSALRVASAHAPLRAATLEAPALRVRAASPEELAGWDALCQGLGPSRLFHRRAWIESLAEGAAGAPRYLVCERQGEIVGCLPGLLRQLGPLRLFGSPLEGSQTSSMGPVFDARRVSTRELMGALLAHLEQEEGAHHVELASDHLDLGAMRALGFADELLFTCRIALYPGDEDRALRNIDGRTRNHLRKAQRLGLRCEREEDEGFAAECYDQLVEVFRRGGNAAPFGPERVRRCFRHMKAAGRLLALSVRLPEGECVATGLFLLDAPEMHLWLWTHRTAHRGAYATELLMWTAMREGMARGCTTLDMGGGGRAKLQYGARPDETAHRFLRSRHAVLARSRALARQAFHLQQSLRGRLLRAVGGP